MCINDVQRLAGRVAALSRFISRLGEKAIPLYQMMKKTDDFVWSDAANIAFEDLKRQLLGNVAEIQNFPTCHQDLSMERPATSRKGRRVCIYIPL